ncbi:MAG: hypothetical protein ACPLKQ_07500 [Candidatus Bathyarchaeales archaeon]
MSRRYARILATAVFLFVLGLSMFCTINHGYAAQNSSGNANPRLLYWPPTYVWRRGDFINIGNGWINAKSIVWSPSGRYLLVYGWVHESRPYGISLDQMKILILDMENNRVAYNFSLDMGSIELENFMSFAFSPDETKIFYLKVPQMGGFPQIFSVNLDGTGSTFVTNLNSTPAYSLRKLFAFDVTSNGFLVYSCCENTYNATSGQYNYTSYIWKHNLATNEKSLVLKLEGMDKLITGLKVSPAGDKVAYAVGGEIWVKNINGADPPTKIASASSGKIAAYLSWTSNGTILTYSEIKATIKEWGLEMEWENGISNVTAINQDGSNKRVILSGGQKLAWSPTKSSLAAYVKVPYAGATEGYPYLTDFTLPITPNPDSDGDGLSDSSEIQNLLNPADPTDVNKDYDEDGLTNLEEINYGTLLANPDSDGDGLSDGVEVKVFKTDPKKADTDGDGISDGLEAAATGLNAFLSVLPDGWIRMILEWKNKTMYVSTNSSVLGVVFDSTNMALSVSVGGPDGTAGIANITVPMEMVNSLSAVKVTLDNQPIDFKISQAGSYAQIYVQYHHSYHDLTAHLGGGGGLGGIDATGILGYWWAILSVAIVAVAAVIALIMIKRR